MLRIWHERAYETQRARLPMQMTFMGLELRISEDVFAPDTDDPDGDPFHRAVEAEVRAGDRVLDMGTGSGVSAILAARAGATVVAVDVNPVAVECAHENAESNGVAERIAFIVGDVFDGVDGGFDLIVFDPPFRWFKPRDLLDVGSSDDGYRALTRFMAQAKDRLRPGGRILLNFGSSGDIDYVFRLIDEARFRRRVTRYGEAIRHGIIAQYYIVRLTA